MRRWIIILIIMGLTGIGVVNAQPAIVVTRCAYDSSEGTGWNLSSALNAGGLIRFNCGTQTRIRITFTHEISRDVIIDGGDRITLDGESSIVMFRLLASGRLTLRNLRITGGRYTGPIRLNLGNQPRTAEDLVYNAGVIQNPFGAPILIENCEFSGNENAIISVNGQVTVRDSLFSENTRTALTNYDGAVMIERTRFHRNGGGLFGTALNNVGGTMTIRDNSEFSRNLSLVAGGAIENSGSLTIEHAVFVNNQAAFGGALSLTGAGSVTIRHSRFEGNTARRDGGAILRRAIPAANVALYIEDSRFRENTADFGGAIALAPGSSESNLGTLTLRGIIFSRNQAREGAAIAGREFGIDVVSSLFAGNTATETGGAIVLRNDTPHSSRLANSLIARNGSRDAVLFGNAMQIVNSTIADNVGGGIVNRRGMLIAGRVTAEDYAIRLSNSLVFANGGSNCTGDIFMDEGHNVQFPDTSCGASIIVAYPWLDGRYAPYDWSPARFGGDDAICAAAPIGGFDLFGERRAQSGSCSIGAVEQSVDRIVRPPEERG